MLVVRGMPVGRRGFLLLGSGFLTALAGCAERSSDAASGSAMFNGPAPHADDGYEAWLRYRPRAGAWSSGYAVEIDGAVGEAIRDELDRALRAMLGATAPVSPREAGIVVGTRESSETIRAAVPAVRLESVGLEGYVLRSVGPSKLVVAANTDRGALYGTFHALRLLAGADASASLDAIDLAESPALPLRLVNHWDNMSGSAERGYAGKSVFDFASLPALHDRYQDYARLLASVGHNGIVVNNVNADPRFLESDWLAKLAPLAEVFAAYGIRTYLCPNFASPLSLGGLPTASPFDAAVQAWWDRKIAEVYETIPDFGGFLVKANSEGQPGPRDYGATHADGANLLARPTKRHGDGIVIWRAFVWHDDGDRARVAYDEFAPLDGRFDDNVIVQVKGGPLDFQIREAVHPLFGKMPRTRTMLEVQLTQEYTGHATHACFLVPMWKEIFDFDTEVGGVGSTVERVVSGVAGVRNVGDVRNWTGHPLAQANTYGFGRLAWNPELSSETIAREWTRLTFSDDVSDVVVPLLLESREVYELYTSPLGVGFMCEGGSHYEPNPADKHYYHQADDRRGVPESAAGVGFDRVASGYASLYAKGPAARFSEPSTCPEELLLFFHHLPYEHRLGSGKTIIQHVYDSHFDGVERVRAMRAAWASLAPKIDPARHGDVLARLDAQLVHAAVWRDSVVGYFFHRSAILDTARRWLAVQRITIPRTGISRGTPTTIKASVTNASPDAAIVTFRFDEPSRRAGWSGEASATVAAGASAQLELAATASRTPPAFEIAAVSSTGAELLVLGPRVAQYITPQGHLRPWTPSDA